MGSFRSWCSRIYKYTSASTQGFLRCPSFISFPLAGFNFHFDYNVLFMTFKWFSSEGYFSPSQALLSCDVGLLRILRSIQSLSCGKVSFYIHKIWNSAPENIRNCTTIVFLNPDYTNRAVRCSSKSSTFFRCFPKWIPGHAVGVAARVYGTEG